MNYNDDALASNDIYQKLAEEFKQRFTLQTEMQVSDEEVKEKVKHLLNLLTLNEQYLTYIFSFMQKNKRYKITAQELKLDKAIKIINKHKEQLLSLNLVSLEKETPQNISKNIKVTIFNCCNNNAEILRTIIWFIIFKNIFSDHKILQQMAYEQAEIMQSVLGLF